MTSHERVSATYEFRPCDRVPLTELCVNHPVASRLLGREAWTGFGGYVRGKIQNTLLAQGRRDEYVERFTSDTLAVNRILGFDLFQVHFMPARNRKHAITEIEKNVWKFDWGGGNYSVQRYDPGTDFYGEVDSSFDRDPEGSLKGQIEGLKRGPPPPPSEGELDFMRRARREFPEHFLWGSAGLGIPYSPAGLESLIEFPSLWRELAEMQAEHAKSWVDTQVSEGVDAFWCGSDWAFKTRPLVSPATFRGIFLESFKELVRHIHGHGRKFIKHTDGNIEPYEEMWFNEVGMDGYHAIEPSAGMDIMAVRRRWPRLLLHGNLDCGRLLTLGSPDEIEAEVARLMNGLAEHGGYVFSSSNSIHSGVPVENLIAMLDAARRHGTRPPAAAAP